MKTLQVNTVNGWKYVFCRNELKKWPVITESKEKAIKGDQHSLAYFQSHFANRKFRIV
jgi:hypothetical protein